MNNIFKKWEKIVHKFKSETLGRFTVNNKQTATIRRVLLLRTWCHPKAGDNTLSWKKTLISAISY